VEKMVMVTVASRRVNKMRSQGMRMEKRVLFLSLYLNPSSLNQNLLSTQISKETMKTKKKVGIRTTRKIKEMIIRIQVEEVDNQQAVKEAKNTILMINSLYSAFNRRIPISQGFRI
jgi:hypothetical protein